GTANLSLREFPPDQQTLFRDPVFRRHGDAYDALYKFGTKLVELGGNAGAQLQSLVQQLSRATGIDLGTLLVEQLANIRQSLPLYFPFDDFHLQSSNEPMNPWYSQITFGSGQRGAP